MRVMTGDRVVSIDALRGVAALCVFLFHYGYFRFGYLGVELFFLISGFVFTLSLRQVAAGEFLVRRFIRLFPTYWLCASMAFVARAYGPDPATAYEYAVNMTMLGGFVGVPYLDGVYWSLTEELVFYALFLCGTQFMRAQPLAMASTMTVGAAAFGLSGTSAHASKVTMAVKYLPLFAGGIVGAVIYRSLQQSNRSAKLALVSCFTYFVTYLATFAFSYSSHLSSADAQLEPFWLFLVWAVFLFCIFLDAVQSKESHYESRWNSFPLMRLLASVGAISYPFYLLHDVFGKQFVRGLLSSGDWLAKPARDALTFIAIFGLSWVIHIMVEVRLGRALRRLLLPAGRTPLALGRRSSNESKPADDREDARS